MQTLIRFICFHLVVASSATALNAGEATLYRDQWGVPHIWGDDHGVAGYAVARAQCEDSIQNVLYCLYAGVGRRTEFAGNSMLSADLHERRLRHVSFAERAWPKLDPPLGEMIEGFCAGVNDYVREHPEEVPVPLDQITPIHVIAWHRSLMTLSAVQICKADAEASKADGYHPEYSPENVGEVGPSEEAEAAHPGIPPGKSNSWVLGESKTHAGVPMLLIDPHWPASGHLQLYEAWLHIGDELNVGGYMLQGTPIPGLGVTPYAAWTVTAGGADSSDAYALKLNPDNPRQYEFDGRWVDMDARTESFQIRQPDGSFKTVTEEVLATRHGPVLETQSGIPFAAAFGGYEQADAINQFYRMAKARSTREFKSALAMNRLSYFNLMWATAAGDIGYVQTGLAPIRSPAFNWEKMVPGWTSASLYEGQLPFEELPSVENPPSGFIQNCNVAANVVTPGQTMKKSDFSPGVLYGHYGQYRARGNRAMRLLTEVDQATIEDGRRIAFDSYVPPADLWIPVILQAWIESEANGTPSDAGLAKAIAILGTWNRYATRDSVGATLFRFWRLACHEMKSQAGRDSFQIPKTPGVRTDSLAALRTAVQRLSELYGKIEVPWGEIKRLRRGEQEWPLSGDGLGKLGMDTLRATAGDSLNDKNRLIASGGQCVTSIVLLTDPPTIHAIVAYGQSNKPNSTHYADQAPLYSDEQLRSVPWTMGQLKPYIESQTTFKYP
jgi:acyl-homoserine-lactone acylase